MCYLHIFVSLETNNSYTLFLMEINPSSTKTSSSISPALIKAVTDAMNETGINPTEFLALFSGCNPAQVLSHFRYILFRAVCESYKAETEIGSFNNELIEHTFMLYEMFYETEEEFIKTEGHRTGKSNKS